VRYGRPGAGVNVEGKAREHRRQVKQEEKRQRKDERRQSKNRASAKKMTADAAIALARSDLACYSAIAWPRFELAHHHRLIIDNLEAIERGQIDRLMIFMPPRHGKSLIASQLFPAWWLGRHPDRSIIASSYGQELATDFGRKVRNHVAEPLFTRIFQNAKISGDSTSAHRFSLLAGGAYYGVGAGGPLTGRGADLLLIDDPIKNREDAGSESYRRSLKDWFEGVAYTRLQPDSSIVIISTRWHQDDLCGWLLREHPEENWTVLNMPAVAETDEGWRHEGDALWPSKFPLSRLETTREAVGGAVWSALYQQRPAAAEGSLFKREWWKYFDAATLPPRFERIVLSLDTAFKAGASNDYSVGLVLGVGRTGYYVLDIWRGKVEFPELKRKVDMLATRWPNLDAMLVEDKASGQSLIQELHSNSRLPVRAIKVDSDKVTRAHAVTALVEAGRVFLPTEAPWLTEFIEEISAFPAAPHDDQVDAFTQALNYCRESSSGIIEYFRQKTEAALRCEPDPWADAGREVIDEYERTLDEIRAIEESCHKCGRPVVGPGVDAGPWRFHKECYDDGTGRPNIEAESANSVARAIVPPWQESRPERPRVCESCRQPINGTATEIGAKRWHPECFPR
jgi:predicted phage terminase large subunit-like protein